jgi:glycosyltransferase involved in cell wall biosynthesis
VLFGDGPERAALESRIVGAGLAGTFRLVGFSTELDALLPWADVVALPSFTEGLPNVALEAGAAGVPVVASEVGGLPEVVANGQTGYLVPPGDANAMATRLTDLLKRPDWAMAFGAAARRRMQAQFSFAGQAQAYQELFAELAPVRGRIGITQTAACA